MALTPQEELELAQLEAAEKPSSGLTPAEEAELAALEAAENPQGREVQAGVQGAGDAMTFGYAPQLNAGIQKGAEGAVSLKDRIAKLLGADSMMSQRAQMEAQGFKLPAEESYVEARDRYKGRTDQLAKENPWSYGAGQVAGTLASGAAIPGGQAAKGASLLAKLTRGAGTGLAMSAVQNPGDVEGVVDPLQMGDRATNAAVGGGIGAAIPLAGNYISPLLKKAADKLAFKALGPFAKEARLANDFGRTGDIGREALENGTIGWIPKGFDTLAKRAKAAAKKAGIDVGEYIDELDKAAAEGKIPGVDRKNVAKKIGDKLIKDDEIVQGVAGAPQKNAKYKKFSKNLADVADGETDGAKKTWERKKLADDNSGWRKPKSEQLTPEEEFNRELAKNSKQEIENFATQVEGKTGKKVGSYNDKSQKYSRALTADRILSLREGHELARRMTAPLVGAGAGGMMALTGDDSKSGDEIALKMLKGAAYGKGFQMLNRFGPQVAAKLVDSAAKMRIPNSPWANVPNAIRAMQGDDNGKE